MEGNEVKDSVIIYGDQLEAMEDLTMEERGEVLTAILTNAQGKPVGNLSGAARVAWGFIRKQIERDRKKYDEKLEARAEAGRKGAAKRWQQSDGKAIESDGKNGKAIQNDAIASNPMAKMADTDTVPDTVTEPDTVPVPVNKGAAGGQAAPTEKEITEYAASLGFGIDAGYFLKYYTQDGQLMANGEPVRDWRALVRSWWRQEQKSRESKVTGLDIARKKNAFHNFDERTDDLEAEFFARQKTQYEKWKEENPDA